MKPNVIVTRSKWRSGTGEGTPFGTGKGNSLLLNEQGFMCCLGFACITLGASFDDILNAARPSEMSNHGVSGQVAALFKDNYDYNTWKSDAMKINDCTRYDNQTREELLSALAKREDSPIGGFIFID